LIVAGAGGRMGRTLVKAIAETDGVTLTGAVEGPHSPFIGQDSGVLAGVGENGIPVGADVKLRGSKAEALIDFTTPQATVVLSALAAQAGIIHVIGTTGLSQADEGKLQEAAKSAAVVKSGNMSLGVNLRAALVKRVAQSLDHCFDIEILEMHHRAKVDAPSGTALLLGEAAAAGRGVDLDTHSARGRDGITGARRPGDIGFASLRGGTVTGDHSVIFAGAMERITLSHHAEDRMMFAQGAIKAALWAREQKPGLYSMADVLGLTDF
jgi:4-hydroxy-tetrahydrodipicolinate reductase